MLGATVCELTLKPLPTEGVGPRWVVLGTVGSLEEYWGRLGSVGSYCM